jgi:ribonuclease HII
MTQANFDTKHGELVIGVDEVGYGAWAGPVCVAAVLLDPNHNIIGLKDSKLITPSKREALAEQIKEKSKFSIILKGSEIIDEINVWEATKLAMKEAVQSLKITYDAILIDGNKNPQFCPKIKCVVDGDNFSPSIAAASIIAKVHRDNLMVEYGKIYEEYLFQNHKGYGTKAHMDAITRHGVTPIHRLSYKPIKLTLGKSVLLHYILPTCVIRSFFMDTFISSAIAAEETVGNAPYDGGGLMSLIPFILMFAVFYFLLIRPQMKKQKEHQEMLDALVVGERVIFAGGIIGTIVKIEEDQGIVHVELTMNVKVQALRSSISEILGKQKKDSVTSKEKKKKLSEQVTTS